MPGDGNDAQEDFEVAISFALPLMKRLGIFYHMRSPCFPEKILNSGRIRRSQDTIITFFIPIANFGSMELVVVRMRDDSTAYIFTSIL